VGSRLTLRLIVLFYNIAAAKFHICHVMPDLLRDTVSSLGTCAVDIIHSIQRAVEQIENGPLLANALSQSDDHVLVIASENNTE
jgi:hypothetical protein